MKRFIFLLIIAMTIISQGDYLFAWHVKHTLKELTESSPLIITGKVAQVSSKIETDRDHKVVFTYVTIATVTILKGELAKPSLTIKMLGGRVGDKGDWSELLFSFKINEEVMLFLHSQDKKNNIWGIKSISGKLSIVNINGIKQYDCSMLRADEISKYDSNPYIEKNVMYDRISDYIQLRKGGK